MKRPDANPPSGIDEKFGDLGRFQSLRRFWLAAGLAALALLLLFVGSAWNSAPVSEGIEYAGLFLIGLGILGRLWCTLYIGGKKAGMVVSTGPYSIMRNPLYFFSAIAALGAGAQSGSIVVALALGLLCVAAFHIVIAREERFLAEKFGAPYLAYLNAVPRFFPSPRLFQDDAVVSVIPKRVYATLLDGLVFFAAVPAFALVEHLQISGVLPVLLRLY